MEYPTAISDLVSKSNTAISRMPINKDELNGDFRKHTAFSVFRLEFYKTKRSLNDEEVKLLLDPHMPTEMDLKTNKLVRRTAGRVDNLSAEWDAGINTTYGYESLAVRKFVGTSRLLSSLWRKVVALVPDRRPSWQQRAVKLNRIKVPGLILRVPRGFDLSLGYMKRCLYRDMQSFTARMQNAMVMGYNRKGATSNPHAYMIGEEKVFIQKAIYRRYVPMSSLLMDYLFGIKYEKLKQFKVNETNSTITCHLSTNESIDKLFSIQGLSPVTFKRDGISYAACGFLRIDLDDLGPTPAYIMRTTPSGKWVLKCAQDTTITLHMDAPEYNEEGVLVFEAAYKYKQYSFSVVYGGEDENNPEPTVPGYHPSRLLVHKSKNVLAISYCLQKCSMVKDEDDGRWQIDTELSS